MRVIGGRFGKKTNAVPNVFRVRMTEALILYYNMYAAASNPDIGYCDAEIKFSETVRKLNNFHIDLTKSELEELLWACTMQAEEGLFWHPNKVKMRDFIYKILHHKQYKYYFDSLYNFFRAKKRTDTEVGEEYLISSEGKGRKRG